MKRVKTLRARTDKYTDRQTGQEKQGYTTMGYMLQKDDGTTMLKVDSIPVNFDGWIFLGDLESKPAKEAMQKPAQPAQEDFEDKDIPF